MANSVEVDFKDLARINARLESLAEADNTTAEKAMQTAVLLVQRSAKVKVANGHSVTGRLLNSIGKRVIKEGDELVGEVYTNVEYAPYLEYGTGVRGEATHTPPVDGELSFNPEWTGHRAYPYMRPALEENKDTIKKLLQDAVKGAMK
nr:MAG TPA: putative tail component [Caudoviricetes sp.]